MADTSITQRGIIRAMTTIREDAIDLRVYVCLRCVVAVKSGWKKLTISGLVQRHTKIECENHASISTAPRRASPHIKLKLK